MRPLSIKSSTFREHGAIHGSAGYKPSAIAAILEENEIRAELSPWERGRIAVSPRDASVFDTINAAVETLSASAAFP